MASELDACHWTTEDWKQRMLAEKWAELLLGGRDKIIIMGKLRTLRARNLGYGVVEVYKEPLKEAAE